MATQLGLGQICGGVGFESASMVMRGGRNPSGDLAVTFVDDRAADRGDAVAKKVLGDWPSVRAEWARECPAAASLDLTVERDGRSLRGRMTNFQPVMAAMSVGACREPIGIKN